MITSHSPVSEKPRFLTREMKKELRQGDSLRAKFFRWKDRVTNGIPTEDIIRADPFKNLHHIHLSNKGRAAVNHLLENPEDPESYKLSVEYFRGIAKTVKESGLNVLPDEPEEE